MNVQRGMKLNVLNSATRNILLLRIIVSEYSELVTFFWLSGKYYEYEL